MMMQPVAPRVIFLNEVPSLKKVAPVARGCERSLRDYSFWMYRLWESFLATIYVAIAATQGPLEHWLSEGAHLVSQKVAKCR